MIPEFVRNAVARRHVAKHEDYLVQDYLRLLREDNAQLRSELSALPHEGFTPSGRFVFVGIVKALLLACAIAAGGLWWNHSGSAATVRAGFRDGGVAAKSGE